MKKIRYSACKMTLALVLALLLWRPIQGLAISSPDTTRRIFLSAWDSKTILDPDDEGPWVVRAYYSNPQLLYDLAAWHEPWEVTPPDHTESGEGYAVLDVTQAEYERLQNMGFRVEVDGELTAKLRQPNQRLPGQVAGIPGYPCYRTVEETFATAEAIVADYPNLATWKDIGDSWEKTQDEDKGYDMMVLRLTQSLVPGPKPKLFVMTSVHAREYTPAELNTRFAEYMVENYNVDPDVTWLLDYHELHLLLQANPDGRKHAEAGLSWRKNTNENYCGPTSNRRGADLNRNFSFQWGCCGGSSGFECDYNYRGPSAASEPETQTIQDYIRAQFPDRRADDLSSAAPVTTTGLFLDIHSYGELVLWSWGFTFTPAPNGIALQTLGRKFAYFNGYEPEQAVGLYPTDGTTDDFVYGELGLAAYTFELGTTFFQDCGSFETTIWPDNLAALLYAAKVVRAPYLLPAGPDVTGVQVSPVSEAAGVPLTLTVMLDDTRYNHDYGPEPSQSVGGATYSVDAPPWEAAAIAAAIPVAMTAMDGAFDHPVENAQAIVDTTNLSPGRHIVFTHGYDADGNWGIGSAAFFTITSNISLTAAFTSNSPVELGSPITFTNLTTGTAPLSYMWDFGDGLGYSTEENPMYVYPRTGTFTVTLNVTDSLGNDWVQHPVTVLPYVCDPVSITALHSVPYVAGKTRAWTSQAVHVAASVLGELPLTYTWDFGDATPALIGRERNSVTHTYPVPNLYTVTLTVTNACPSMDTMTTTAKIYPRPQIMWNEDVYLNGVLINEIPFDIVDDDMVQIMDRIAISTPIPITLTLVETRTEHLALSEWVSNAGYVQVSPNGIAWHIAKAMTDIPYSLTQTFKINPGAWHLGSITKIIKGQDLEFWLADRVITFTHRYPRIAVSPASMGVEVSSEEITTRSIVIRNDGSADLRWNLQELPDVTWLMLPNKTNHLPGLTSPLEKDSVTITLNATLTPGGKGSLYVPTVYTTTLMLMTNDPLSKTITLPVTLTVKPPAYVFLPLVLRYG